jgi:hypothetical protein
MSKIEVDAIEPQSGTSLTVGASGDTITIPAGATFDASSATLTLPDSSVSLAKLTATGTKDATTFLRGDNTFQTIGTNTPAFLVRNSAVQAVADDTFVKALFNTVIIDTDSAFASDKFTVPAGQGGRYFIYAIINLNSEVNSNLDGALAQIKKNGSDITGAGVEFLFLSNPIKYSPVVVQIIIDLVATDYIEVFTRLEATDSTGGVMMSNSTFGGYKLIS